LFQKMLKDIHPSRILEVGCNRGHNLVALAHVFGDGTKLVGIEPNTHARALARTLSSGAEIVAGDAYDLPFKQSAFDLVLTWGVLIHVPLEKLPVALAEIWRVTAQYILSVEYYAEKETAIQYRGHGDLLWKRDFRRHYQAHLPDLGLLREGYWGKQDREDKVNWWLLSKPSS